jgi:lysophospholipase L1-like esterase
MSGDVDRPADSYWEPEIRTFEAADRVRMPEPGGILFVGSSSIALWHTIEADFPDLPVIRRGFNGSKITDSTQCAERIIVPYRPRVVVVYAGDNDLADQRSPKRVSEDFRVLARKIHAALPATKILFTAIKPSPSRWGLVGAMREANQLIRAICERDPRLGFVDVFTPMLGPDGAPRPELYVEDRLHMSRAGYNIWTLLLRPRLDSALSQRSGH